MVTKSIVPVNPTSTNNGTNDTNLRSVVINIPFPKERMKSDKYKNCKNDWLYLINYITKYVAIFFVLSFIGKIGAKFIYWANETNDWKYPDGWDWGDISSLIFLQAFIGILIVGLCIGCCVKQ